MRGGRKSSGTPNWTARHYARRLKPDWRAAGLPTFGFQACPETSPQCGAGREDAIEIKLALFGQANRVVLTFSRIALACRTMASSAVLTRPKESVPVRGLLRCGTGGGMTTGSQILVMGACIHSACEAARAPYTAGAESAANILDAIRRAFLRSSRAFGGNRSAAQSPRYRYLVARAIVLCSTISRMRSSTGRLSSLAASLCPTPSSAAAERQLRYHTPRSSACRPDRSGPV